MAQVTDKELDSIVAGLKIAVVTEAAAQKTLVTYHEIKDFFDREKRFWDNNSQGRLGIFRDFFNTIASDIQVAAQVDQSAAREKLVRVVNSLHHKPLQAIYSSTRAAQFLVSTNKENPQRADGAVDYLLNQVGFQNMKTNEYFDGVLSAALFQKTGLLDRFLAVDRAAFDSLRGDIREFRNGLESDYKRITDDIESWKTKSEGEIKGFLDGSKTQFDNSYTKWGSAVDNFQTESKEKIKAMEGLYQEKLRLDAPAKYWQDLRDTYKKCGRVVDVWLGTVDCGSRRRNCMAAIQSARLVEAKRRYTWNY